MTPDPVYDQLAGFTPAPAPDPAEVLFRAGRASAPTRPVWKLAVAGLLALNAATATALFLRPAPEPVAVVVPGPPAPAEAVPTDPPAEPSATAGLLARRTDPDAWHRPTADLDYPPDYPLTLAEARRSNVE